MRRIIAFSVVAAGAVAVAVAVAADDGGPPLDLPPAAGGLVGVVDVGRRDAVVRLDPRDLHRRSRPLALPGVASQAALSPDGRMLAIGDGNLNRVTLVDLRRWRVVSTLRVPAAGRARYPGVVALSWPRPRRLLALAGLPGWRNTLTLLDPLGRRSPRTGLWQGAAAHAAATPHGMVLLGVPALRRGIAPAQVVFAEPGGRVRATRLRRFPAGARWNGRTERIVYPGLAAHPDGTRVVVVGERLAAEVGRDGGVAYHDLRLRRSPLARLRDLVEPPARAGGAPTEGTWREARMLAGGTVAVSGYEAVSPPPAGYGLFPQRALGVTLVDTSDWQTSKAVPGATTVRGAGSLALGVAGALGDRSITALTAVDSAGRQRFARFRGAGATVLATSGRRAYVDVRRGRGPATHVVDLRDGHTLHVARRSAIRQVLPVGVGPAASACSYLGLGERLCLP